MIYFVECFELLRNFVRRFVYISVCPLDIIYYVPCRLSFYKMGKRCGLTGY